MGMDLLHITFDIEKIFDIKFSMDDHEAIIREQDIMVGDLYTMILRKMAILDVVKRDVSLNYEVWTRLRDAIRSVAAHPPERLELRMPLAQLFPRNRRGATWEALRDACPYEIPKLEYPRSVRIVGFSIAALVVFIEQRQIWQMRGMGWLWLFLGLVGFWMLIETYAKVLSFLAHFRNRFPTGMVTVKDLCRSVLVENSESICHDVEIPLDERCIAVWQQLTEVLAQSLGVDADEVTYRSLLVRDLGME